MARVEAQACKCNKCGYIWLPHKSNPDPVTCARCKSPYWNRTRKR